MDITDLLEKLDVLSAWRKKELLQAQFLAENAENESEARYLCRAWVLMMYAHCDNFLKESAQTYLSYLKCNEEKLAKYKQEVMWLIVKGPNLQKADGGKYKSMNDYFRNTKFIDEKVTTEILKIGSFNYKLLRYYCDWVLQINFNHEEFQNFCKTLKLKRDSIAHGERSYVSLPADCSPWQTDTIKFIDLLKTSIIDSAEIETNGV